MTADLSSLEVRVWLGWRSAALVQDPDGWRKFVDELGATFIPATWQAMSHYGLRCYLPTVLPQDRPPGVADEVALLFYESKQAYEASKKHVGGRAYGVMHRALFEFGDARRKSRSAWAGADGVASPMRRPAMEGGARLASPDAVVHVAAVAHPPGVRMTPGDVLGTLAGEPGEAVVSMQETFTLLWFAASEARPVKTVAQALASALEGQIVCAHVADARAITADYFADAFQGVSVQADQTLKFAS